MPTLAPSLTGLHPINLLHSHACQLPSLWPGCCNLPSWLQLHFPFFSSSRIFFCQIPLSFPPGNIYLCVKELIHAKQPKSAHILWKVKHMNSDGFLCINKNLMWSESRRFSWEMFLNVWLYCRVLCSMIVAVIWYFLSRITMFIK